MSDNSLTTLDEPRKIYIECILNQDEINKRYGFLDNDYERTTSPKQSDFIIVDLNNPPVRLERGLLNMKPKIVKCKPLILTSFKDETEMGNRLRLLIKQIYNFELPVCKNQTELKNMLGWYSFIICPYWEVKHLEKAATDMALKRVKDRDTDA